MQQDRIVYEGDTGIPGLALFGYSAFNRAFLPLAPHVHRGMMEIVFLLRGVQVYQADGRDYPIQGGEAFVSYPDELHGTGGSPQESAAFYWVQLTPGEESFLGLTAPAAAPLRDRLGRLPGRVFPFSGEVRGLLRRAFTQMRLGGEEGRARAAVLLAAALYALPVGQNCTALPVSVEIRRALAYADAHLDESLPLEELARESGLSLPRFKTRFHEETGTPPREYVNRLKVRRAQCLLRQGLSVTDVSQRLGFSTPNYFATVFRRFTAATPSAYAREATGDSEAGIIPSREADRGQDLT